MCEWIMRDPTMQIQEAVSFEAVAAIQSVLSASPFVLDDILDEHGIVTVNVTNNDAEMVEDNTSVARAPAASAGDGDRSMARNSSPPRHANSL